VIRAGGYTALLRKHPWLQNEDSGSSVSLYSRENPDDDEERERVKAPVGDELPLAESQWRKAQADADKVS
jgi:hypothetical protein